MFQLLTFPILGFSYGAIPTKEPRPQSQQSQVVSSQQQSSSSYSQQSVNQTSYECHNINGGVMKGYREKNGAFEQQQEQAANNRDSGIFTGINGDANSLVDEEFDYKKHSVKDLAKHFALVKPKTNIPHNILPEQRMFNGDQAPQLNYLGAGENGGAVLQAGGQANRREVSQQDIEASKQAYEMKKKQQMEAQQQSSSSTTTTTSSSTVVRRTESSSEQKSERRMSLRDSLMLDPAKAHTDAGIIDPSAILRGEAVTLWQHSDPCTPKRFSLIQPSNTNSLNHPKPSPPSQSSSKSSLPPLPSKSSTTNSSSSVASQQNTSSKLANNHSASINDTQIQTRKEIIPLQPNNPAPLIVLDPIEPSLDSAPATDLIQSSTQNTMSSHHHASSVLYKNILTSAHDSTHHEELAVSRSQNPTPAPTTPFPGQDHPMASILNIPNSPTLPRTPILVTTRPSSVILDRHRHVSKDDIAKMMAELNAPLPPMQDIPDEIRASPLIFTGGLTAHPRPQSSLSSPAPASMIPQQVTHL